MTESTFPAFPYQLTESVVPRWFGRTIHCSPYLSHSLAGAVLGLRVSGTSHILLLTKGKKGKKEDS